MNLEPSDRPRERLISRGPQVLTDQELLSVVLGSGTRAAPVNQVAHAVLEADPKRFDSRGNFMSLERLRQVPGLGTVGALRLAAAAEFFRRRFTVDTRAVHHPEDLLPILRSLVSGRQEHFLVVAINGAQEIISARTVALGPVNRVLVHPREVFAQPITEGACGVVVAHNHLSSPMNPSESDLRLTRALQAAGRILGISVLDHIIFSDSRYLSLAEAGLLGDDPVAA